MDISYEFAAGWLQTIAITAGILWAAGALFVLRSAQIVKQRVEGEANVSRPPKDSVEHLKHVLMRGIANSPLTNVRLLEVRDNSIVWEGGVGRLKHSGSLLVSGNPGRFRVVWQLEGSSALITGAIWVVAIGALTIAGLYYLLSEYVLPSQIPAIRGQVFQMCQAVHLMWPPFLIAGLARGAKRQLVRDVDRTIGNLQFTSAG